MVIFVPADELKGARCYSYQVGNVDHPSPIRSWLVPGLSRLSKIILLPIELFS